MLLLSFLNKVEIMYNSFIILLLASIFEIGWIVFLKYSNSFSNLFFSILTIISAVISFFLLSIAMKSLPVGIAYSVWTGIGIAGSTLLGVILFSDILSLVQTFFIALILIGVIGIYIFS